MKFQKINQLILFGGSRSLADFALFAAAKLPHRLSVWSAPRHLDEKVPGYGRTLRQILRRAKLRHFESVDINREAALRQMVTANTLGLAFGAAWLFEKPLVRKFAKGHLLDLMGIDLPRYRGGAHYTWQILHSSRKGCVNLQVIEGGAASFHRGRVIKRAEYALPAKAARPIDYFDHAASRELNFLKEFFREAAAGKNFPLQKLDETKSSYYPFLSTLNQGWINWSWSGEEIARFIHAFGAPYPGASTMLRGRPIQLRECEVLPAEENYHPFSAGLVVRKDKNAVYAAARGALLRLPVMRGVKLGDRFWTPAAELDKAMAFSAVYSAEGLTK